MILVGLLLAAYWLLLMWTVRRGNDVMASRMGWVRLAVAVATVRSRRVSIKFLVDASQAMQVMAESARRVTETMAAIQEKLQTMCDHVWEYDAAESAGPWTGYMERCSKCGALQQVPM